MLRISKLADYATIILSYMASHTGIASASHIATAVNLRTPTVSKLLKILLESKIVQSARGIGGGYQLARPADQISLVEILTSIEGQMAITECCMNSHCTLDALCTLKENWQFINSSILKSLASISLHDMIQPLAKQPCAFRSIEIKPRLTINMISTNGNTK